MAGRVWISTGAILAGIAVALGAIGAHLLKQKLSAEHLATFETAVRYQMYHAAALILVGIVAGSDPSRLFSVSAWLFLVGIALFSGGIYGWLATDKKPFVHIVPIGGTTWIVAWICFAIAAIRRG